MFITTTFAIGIILNDGGRNLVSHSGCYLEQLLCNYQNNQINDTRYDTEDTALMMTFSSV